MPVDVTTGGPSTWKAETTPPSRALDEVLDCGRAQLIPAVAKSGLAASRPYSAIYLDFFQAQRRAGLFRQSGARCPSSLGDELPVLDTTLPQRHMADSTSPTTPIPCLRNSLPFFPVQNLASVVSISFPGWSKSLSSFDSSSSPLANPRSLHSRLSQLSSGARWVRFSNKPNLRHSFLTRPQLGVVDGLRNKPFTYEL